jgi:hypothetical protein
LSKVKGTILSPAGSKTMKRHRSSVVAAGALLCVSLMPAAWAESLTLEQEIAKLKNSEDGSPVEIKQSQPDFLGGAYYLQVEVLAPYHPRFANYVFRADKGLYSAGSLDDLNRLPAELGMSIKDADMALRFAQWRLLQTEGGSFWLVSSAQEVPFISPEKTPIFAKDVQNAKTAIAGMVTPPTASTDHDGFTIVQHAVLDDMLMRYQAQIGRDATWSCTKAILARHLPVVSVAPAKPPLGAACPQTN